jgi:membrane-bound lytic murein transglycosylase D
MWQFMPATGRAFELKQNAFRDDRRDVLASTRAALDYLEQLHAHVRRLAPGAGGLQLGPGQRAARQNHNRVRGRPTDYASLRMPDETRSTCPSCRR